MGRFKRSKVMPLQRTDNPVLKALLTILADPSVTEVRARGRAAEIYRAGKVQTEELTQVPAEFERAIEHLLSPGRPSGSVTLRGFSGFAAIPPVSSEAVLSLRRSHLVRISVQAACEAGLLTAPIARLVSRLLSRGAGCIAAGAPVTRTAAVLTALLQQLPDQVRLTLVEDEPRITPPRQAVRLRDLPADLLRSTRGSLVVLDMIHPPSLLTLTPPVLAWVSARSPQAALARAAIGRDGRVNDSGIRAALLADIAPLLLWYGAGSRLEQVAEILPAPGRAGEICRLQVLLLRDQASDRLVQAGAEPRDPALAQAWDAAMGRDT